MLDPAPDLPDILAVVTGLWDVHKDNTFIDCRYIGCVLGGSENQIR